MYAVFSQYLIYTMCLHRSLFTLRYGGSYLNRTLLIVVGISIE
jgi:hypothetical protein